MNQIADTTHPQPMPAKRRAHYGIDAPGIVIGLGVSGALLALVAVLGPPSLHLAVSLSIGAACAALLLLWTAAEMLRSSLVSKMRVRDRLVAALGLSGTEHVLDAGCGRGLALIGCAKKLTTGRATGIDLWSARDLSSNNPDATRANAEAEGVGGKIAVETGDITHLPFADASFDAIISMTVIHNIPSQDARNRALSELVRVLKPGGRIAIFDILFTPRYAVFLRQQGLEVRELRRDRLWLFPCASLLATKPQTAA